MDNNNENKINLIGKVATFPKNVKAKNAYNYLEDIKISKRKLWYFIIEKDLITDNSKTDIQLIKYNNKQGFDCKKFTEHLKTYYQNNEAYKPYIDNLIIEGNSDYSTIRNIPNVEIDGKKLVSIITQHLIKLLK